jgi:hypothetical protein
MNHNPYQPPAPLTGLPQYYTDDITLMPATVIWRTVRRQSLSVAMMSFPYFLARKALRLRHPANHGTSRVTELPAIPEEQIPPHITQAFAPFIVACRACQMEPVQCFRTPCIGNKTIISSMWLDPTGTIYGSITWIDLRLGAFHKTKAVFACHSWLESGTEWHTSPMAPEDWIPELVPPGQEILALPPDLPPAQVIERHQQRLAGRSDVRRFDKASLLQEVLRASQERFDYLVSRGIYAPLTEAETERLMVGKPTMP